MWVLQPTTQPGGYQMTQKMSPLRRRMIEDMTVRNLSPATQRSYISAVLKFSRYFGRSPDQLELEDVRAFQIHLVSTGISWPGLNQTVCALRFFYGIMLGDAQATMEWYSRRGDDSENRIKDLKIGFGMEYMLCGSFRANAAFFSIGALTYNLYLGFRCHVLVRRAR